MASEVLKFPIRRTNNSFVGRLGVMQSTVNEANCHFSWQNLQEDVSTDRDGADMSIIRERLPCRATWKGKHRRGEATRYGLTNTAPAPRRRVIYTHHYPNTSYPFHHQLSPYFTSYSVIALNNSRSRAPLPVVLLSPPYPAIPYQSLVLSQFRSAVGGPCRPTKPTAISRSCPSTKVRGT